MRLIHRDQRQPFLGQHLRESRHAQPFRRNEKKLHAAVKKIHAGLPRHAALDPGVNPRHAQPQRSELRCLVVHQRNQR